MGRIAWEPVRSRLRPSESVPANGRPADQMPGLDGSSNHPGAPPRRARRRRIARTPEAKQISDRGCAGGSRSAFIIPLTAGNWAHRDPREGRGAPRDESRCRETREETLGSTNLSTKRQRIAELARTKAGTSITSVRFSTGESRLASCTPTRAKLSREEPDAGNLHVRVCEGWGW